MNVVNFFLLFLDFQDEEDLRGRPLGLNNRRRRQSLFRAVRQGKRSHVVLSPDVVIWRRFVEIVDVFKVDSPYACIGNKLLGVSYTPKIAVAYKISIHLLKLIIFVTYSSSSFTPQINFNTFNEQSKWKYKKLACLALRHWQNLQPFYSTTCFGRDTIAVFMYRVIDRMFLHRLMPVLSRKMFVTFRKKKRGEIGQARFSAQTAIEGLRATMC